MPTTVGESTSFERMEISAWRRPSSDGVKRNQKLHRLSATDGVSVCCEQLLSSRLKSPAWGTVELQCVDDQVFPANVLNYQQA